VTPTVGQRVRRITAHWGFPAGQLGTIDVVHENGQDFWVATDAGSFNGWTSYDQWAPFPTHSAGLPTIKRWCVGFKGNDLAWLYRAIRHKHG